MMISLLDHFHPTAKVDKTKFMALVMVNIKDDNNNQNAGFIPSFSSFCWFPVGLLPVQRLHTSMIWHLVFITKELLKESPVVLFVPLFAVQKVGQSSTASALIKKQNIISATYFDPLGFTCAQSYLL